MFEKGEFKAKILNKCASAEKVASSYHKSLTNYATMKGQNLRTETSVHDTLSSRLEKKCVSMRNNL